MFLLPSSLEYAFLIHLPSGERGGIQRGLGKGGEEHISGTLRRIVPVAIPHLDIGAQRYPFVSRGAETKVHGVFFIIEPIITPGCRFMPRPKAVMCVLLTAAHIQVMVLRVSRAEQVVQPVVVQGISRGLSHSCKVYLLLGIQWSKAGVCAGFVGQFHIFRGIGDHIRELGGFPRYRGCSRIAG